MMRSNWTKPLAIEPGTTRPAVDRIELLVAELNRAMLEASAAGMDVAVIVKRLGNDGPVGVEVVVR